MFFIIVSILPRSVKVSIDITTNGETEITTDGKTDNICGISRRFSGDRGKILLTEILSQSSLFTSVHSVGELADKGELLDIEVGREIIKQGGEENDIFFIVSGKFNIVINGRILAVREPVNHIGEMALIDPTARRSASVVAAEDSVVLRLSEEIFSNFADANPLVWRRISVELGKRLKERSKLIIEPRSEPVMFIACSAESLEIARTIQNSFQYDRIIVQLWTDSVFQPSHTSIEDLLAFSKRIDFGIVVLTPDDIVESRNSVKWAPRDNVIFELGLILGSIGRERSFLVSQVGIDLKLPSDLLGINQLIYSDGSMEQLSSRLGPACNQLRRIIREKGSI